jgi:lipoyl(octanoyl) transferase
MLIRQLGRADYLQTWQQMRRFTLQRGPDTPDELWLCEHDRVYTQGLAGRASHVLDPREIPVVQTDRGGQVTYHGPGQVVAYPLVDLRRLHIYVKEYVFRLETAVLQTLEGYGLTGHRVPGAPGIYVRLAAAGAHERLAGPAPSAGADGVLQTFLGLGKVAALGLKVSNHCTYHGVALNVAMDLEPFARINPCGYPGLATVDLATLGVATDVAEAARRLGERLVAHLGP